MTLSTNIYVLDRIPLDELFRHRQSLLTEYDEQRRSPDQQIWSDGDSWRKGCMSRANRPGQGLPAILDITHRGDEPLRTTEQAAKHDDDCDANCDGTYHDIACWLDIDFDTVYGYRGPGGISCSQLHAVLVMKAGGWLDQRGVRWSWRNEYTGEVHGGDDRYDQLAGLTSSGQKADNWFRNTVAPFISEHIGQTN